MQMWKKEKFNKEIKRRSPIQSVAEVGGREKEG
jgi:hypothetical protein